MERKKAAVVGASVLAGAVATVMIINLPDDGGVDGGTDQDRRPAAVSRIPQASSTQAVTAAPGTEASGTGTAGVQAAPLRLGSNGSVQATRGSGSLPPAANSLQSAAAGRRRVVSSSPVPIVTTYEWRWIVDERGDVDLTGKPVNVRITVNGIYLKTVPAVGDKVSRIKVNTTGPVTGRITAYLESGDYVNGKGMPSRSF